MLWDEIFLIISTPISPHDRLLFLLKYKENKQTKKIKLSLAYSMEKGRPAAFSQLLSLGEDTAAVAVA